ncbi:MAG TPA: hypothetical protein VFT78_08220 [Hanamia sp.]|nr:hypothetical protein [Hanamia sp.]
MKQLSLLLAFIFVVKLSISQGIDPLPDAEYCPNVEYTFTATIKIVVQLMLHVRPVMTEKLY